MLGYHPLRPDPPGADTPPGADPQGPDTPLEQTFPWEQTQPPGPDPPQDQTSPGREPPRSRLQHTVYERPVRILLECILVRNEVHFKSYS